MRNANEAQDNQLMPLGDGLPLHLPVLTVKQAILFPGMIVPLILTKEHHKNMINAKGHPFVGIVVSHETERPITSEKEIFRYGIAGRILKKVNLPDGNVSVLINCLRKFEVTKVLQPEPNLLISVSYPEDISDNSIEVEALARMAMNQFKLISQENPLVTEEMRFAMANVEGPAKLSNLLAAFLVRDNETYLDLLSALDVKKRLEKLVVLLKKEVDVHNFQTKLQNEINESFGKTQKDFILHEQLKFIKKELGQTENEKTSAKNKFGERIAKLKLSAEAEKRIQEEMNKLEFLGETSPEFSVTYNYLDTMTSLPWGVSASENFDIDYAKKVLRRDHYGLKDVKERILEFVAVRKLKNNSRGSIICFVGPPGVGKTSLGKSIARALKRPFFRFSVGGLHDEAEIKGHRRTYIGAMPGKIIQGLKKTGVNNPVLMIDEIDKLGRDYRGDPASALLEALDPEQNIDFLDHYLDVSFDCGNILFICTANQIDTIPQPLLDRMEVVRLPGYIQEEKLAIAKKHILPRQLERNGLKATDLELPKETLVTLINNYAREAGVRSLEQVINQICRKRALEVAQGKNKFNLVKPSDLDALVGPPFFTDADNPKLKPGMSVGLAWTPMGGDTLTIESVAIAGNDPNLKLTGQMGNVMAESANIAWTYNKKILSSDKKAMEFFRGHSVHLHVPAGAIPKDGPSAGISLASSLYSLATGKVQKSDVAMTGELTLTGDILPVGGIREKVVAAKRKGYKEIILPASNRRELREIPAWVKRGVKFHSVKNMKQVIKLAFR